MNLSDGFVQELASCGNYVTVYRVRFRQRKPAAAEKKILHLKYTEKKLKKSLIKYFFLK